MDTAIDGLEDGQNQTEAAADKEDNKQYDLDLILDIPLEVRAELGKVKIIVNELLQLGQGSIIELNKPANDLVCVYVSDKLIGKGEVVVVDEKFGIRLTEIASPMERVKSLG